MNFIAIAQSGFDSWAAKPHNKKWFRRVDGTPIPNDVVVCIAQAFSEAKALYAHPYPSPEQGEDAREPVKCRHCLDGLGSYNCFCTGRSA